MSAQRRPTPAGGRRSPAPRTGGRSGRSRRRSLGRRIFRGLLITGFAGLVLGALGFAYLYASTDIPDPNQDFEAQTSFVYYANGKTELGRFATQNRQSIPLSEVPQHVQDAVVAAEDRTFWQNKGIDPKGILRAAFSNASGNSTQGASTITQQYVKVFYLSQERTYSRKIKEAFLSLKIHNQRSKQEILQGYLNTIYFGRGAYGVQAAAQAYFNVDAKELTVKQGAVLASVLNAPGYFDPAEGKDAKERLFQRYQYVLKGMADMGTLERSVAERDALRLPKFPKPKVQDSLGGPKGFLLSLVKAKLRQLAESGQGNFTDADIEGGGLRVTTTFSPKMQRAAVQAVKEERPTVNAKGVNIGLAAVQPGTGELKAIYGGPNYVKDQRNWALTGRQPGSTFKPFALAAGLMNGFSLFDNFEGNVYKFPDGREVHNEGDEHFGPVNLLNATIHSINTAYVDLTSSIPHGPQEVINAAVRAGIPSDAPGLKPDPTITLGTADISPVDLASAYATFANQGIHDDWFAIQKVTDPGGDVLYRHRVQDKRAFPEDVNSNVVYAQQQVVKSGTGTAAQALGCPAAGKTGTANLRPNSPGVTSAWFGGYTPKLSAAVMYVKGAAGTENLDGVGGLTNFFGASYPARTWTAFMQKALAGQPCASFPPVNYVNGSPTPTSTPTPTPTETPSPTSTPTPTPTPTQGPKNTPPPFQSPSPSNSQSPTPILPPPGSSSSPPGNGNGNGGGGGGTG